MASPPFLRFFLAGFGFDSVVRFFVLVVFGFATLAAEGLDDRLRTAFGSSYSLSSTGSGFFCFFGMVSWSET